MRGKQLLQVWGVGATPGRQQKPAEDVESAGLGRLQDQGCGKGSVFCLSLGTDGSPDQAAGASETNYKAM